MILSTYYFVDGNGRHAIFRDGYVIDPTPERLICFAIKAICRHTFNGWHRIGRGAELLHEAGWGKPKARRP